MAGTDEAAVAVGGAGANSVLLEQADLLAGFCQIVSTGQADDAAANNQNIAVFLHQWLCLLLN